MKKSMRCTVWHLFLTKWPHMKPDIEGTGSDMELLQVLWQLKKQILCVCGGAQEISAVPVHSEFQGMWCLPVINTIYEIRTILFMKFGMFSSQLWPFIWMYVHLNLKSRSRLQFKATHLFKIFWKRHWDSFKRFWLCFNGKFAQINLRPQFLFCWNSRESSCPSPPKYLLHKPPSESHWYCQKLDIKVNSVKKVNLEMGLNWHSSLLAQIIG